MMEDMEMVDGEEMVAVAAAVGMAEEAVVEEEDTVGEEVAEDMVVADEAEVGGRMLELLVPGLHKYGAPAQNSAYGFHDYDGAWIHLLALALPNRNGMYSIAMAKSGLCFRRGGVYHCHSIRTDRLYVVGGRLCCLLFHFPVLGTTWAAAAMSTISVC